MVPVIENVSTQELRKFGLIMGAAFILIFGLLLPWVFDHGIPKWPWIVAAVFILWALAHPASLQPVYKLWMKIGGVLGFINTRIILGILFFFIFLPIGMLFKLFGKELIPNKFSDAVSSYREASQNPPKEHMEKPY